MKTYLSLLLALIPIISSGGPAKPDSDDGSAVLDAVRARFPEEPVSISGTITVRRRRGVVVKEMGYELKGSWDADGANVRCLISDAFGRNSDTVEVSFKAGGESSVTSTGAGLVSADGHVKDTALNCEDLAMPFLWWQECTVAGKETSRGRDTYVLDLYPPQKEKIARVRVWIDSAIFVVLKAELYTAKDRLHKQVLVKSFKKIEDRWMIKDLEVSMASAPEKTVVTVDAMESKPERDGEESS